MIYDFPPPRQPGITIHVSLMAVLSAICLTGAWLTTNTKIDLSFTLYILLTVLAFLPLPFLAYRLYALNRASYRLDRDKLTLTWGLRLEQIPISSVEWVRPADKLDAPLLLPMLHLPGSVIGTRRQADGGTVEFMASDTRHLLLVSTGGTVLAISPSDGLGFVQNIQRAIEMGSLAPAPTRSVYPSFVVGEAWLSPLARYLWLAGLFLNIGLLVWVSLMIPSLSSVPIGFLPSGEPQAASAGVRLILLPIVSILLLGLGWVAGLYFYRAAEQRLLSFLLWGNSVLATVLLLLAVMFMVTA